MPEDEEKQAVVQAVKKAGHLLLVIPQRPTGDHIGALTGLSQGLTDIKKNIASVSPDPIPKTYDFLKNIEQIPQKLVGSKEFILEIDQGKGEADHIGYKLEEGKLKITITPRRGNFSPDDVKYRFGEYQYDLILTLGASELAQLGRIYQADPELFYKTKLANIDHNPKNRLYGQINWVESRASSLSEMMVSLMESLEINLTGDIATSLLTGLMDATDSFQSRATTAKILTIAAQLIGAGADRNLIVKKLFQTAPYLHLKGWGRIMENLTIDPTLGLTWSTLTKEEISQLAISPETIREALDQLLTKVQEAEVAALIQQTGSREIKVSLRSHGQVDVSELARRFGGGGQKNSAGFLLKGENFPELKKRAVRLLKKYQKENQ